MSTNTHTLASSEIRCHCGGPLKIVCTKHDCEDPLEEIKKAKGPIPVAPRTPEKAKKHRQPLVIVPGICKRMGCYEPVAPRPQGRGRPPTQCVRHMRPRSTRKAA